MTPFERSSGSITVRLSSEERGILATVPRMIEESGDAGGRFDYLAHADDEEAEHRYKELIGSSLEDARAHDRARLAETVHDEVIDDETAQAWMRAIGDARLVLADRLGIEEDGWEEVRSPADSALDAMLAYLGGVQDALVEVLD